jgi:hypothetical protein
MLSYVTILINYRVLKFLEKKKSQFLENMLRLNFPLPILYIRVPTFLNIIYFVIAYSL